MRHASNSMTMDTYVHLFPGQEADAVSRLAEVMSSPMSAAATGTDGENIYPHSSDTARSPKIDGNQASHALGVVACRRDSSAFGQTTPAIGVKP